MVVSVKFTSVWIIVFLACIDEVVCSSTTFNPPSTSTSKSASSTTSTRSTLSSASTVHPSTTAGGTTTTVPPVLLDKKCTNVTKCADPRSVCRPRRCDGMVCQCDVGYKTNAKLNICEKANLIGEPCNKTKDKDCLPRHSVCNSKNVCECDANFRATSDNFWCIGTGYKALGDSCTTGDKCGIGADCQSGTCACVKWHAPWGKKEKWFGIPLSRFSQCENTNATLNSCNGTTFAPPVDTTSTTSIMQSTSTSQTPNSIQTVQNIANQSTTEIPTPTSALTTQPAKNTASQSPTGMPTPTSDLTTQSAQNTTSLSPTVMTTPANYLTTQSARNTILSTTVMPASLISGGHTTKMPSTPTLHSTVPTHGGPGHKSKEKAFPLEAVAIPSAIGGLFLLIIWVVIIVAMCRRRRKKEDRRASKRSRNDTEVSELSTDDQQGSFRQVPIPRPQLTLDSAVKPLYSGFLSPSQPNPYSFYDPYKSDGYFRV